ncbi:unnamed protein product [Closterium sp. Yama58-4]|nr:unnamed protein product [Closterium sp. Yama58-4]
MATQIHNPDDEMALVDEDLQLDGEELHLDELPVIPLAHPPTADAPPAAKKVCVEAPPPAPVPSAPSRSVMSAFAPSLTGSASGAPLGASSPALAAPAPPLALHRSASPISPRPGAALGAGVALAAHAPSPAPSRTLRRPRPGPVMPRRRLAVVTLLLPETGVDAIRADLIARITAMLKPHFFRRGSVPEFEVATSEPLRVPRRAYAKLCFSWLTEEEAEDFKRLFPRSIPLSASRSVLLKVFEDRNPGFTAAKAPGAATLSLRNIPPGFTPEDVREFLLHGANPSEPAWLADLQFFHRTTDPYEEVFLPVFTSIPLPPRMTLPSPASPLSSRLRTTPLPPCSTFPPTSAPTVGTITVLMAAAVSFCTAHLPLYPDTLSPCPPYCPLFPGPPLTTLPAARWLSIPHPSPQLLCFSSRPLSASPCPAPQLSPGFCARASPSPRILQPLGSGPSCFSAILPRSPFISPTAASWSLLPPYVNWLACHNTPCLPSTPPYTLLSAPAMLPLYLLCSLLLSPPPLLPLGQILGARPAPDAFCKDPGFLYIGLDTDVEPWTCVPCNFACGPALDSAMVHMASDAHTSNLRAAAKGPAAKEKYSNWRALTFLATPQIAAFLSHTPTTALEAPPAAACIVLASDFNSVVLPEDRNRTLHGHEQNEAASVSNLLSSHSLLDSFRALHPATTLFSYIGRQRLTVLPPPPPPAARLDRIYVSTAFLSCLHASHYLLTPNLISDHLSAPLCSLGFDNPIMAPRPWRLSASLLRRPHLTHILDAHLLRLSPQPTPDDWDHWKQQLSLSLKCFSNEERRHVSGTMAHLRHLIGRLQTQAACSALSMEDNARLNKAGLQLMKYEASKTAELALKAKLKVEGHHEMGLSSLLAGLNARIKASLISSLTLSNGDTSSHLPSMTTECTCYFQHLYSGSTPVVPNPSFWRHIPRSTLPDSLSRLLQSPLSLSEIGKALGQLSRGKTPGPNGLAGELFRSFTPRFALAFHSLIGSQSPTALPLSMLFGRTVLIPKKGDSTLVENLRPITLMNSDYKVLALCLANRLQCVLSHIIHPSQTAFIKCRKIGDTINDTLDIMDWASYSRTPLLTLTVDFRKAYDLVDRAFLLPASTLAICPLGMPHAL